MQYISMIQDKTLSDEWYDIQNRDEEKQEIFMIGEEIIADDIRSVLRMVHSWQRND